MKTISYFYILLFLVCLALLSPIRVLARNMQTTSSQKNIAGWQTLPPQDIPTNQIIVKYKTPALYTNLSEPAQDKQVQRLSEAAGVPLVFVRLMSGDAQVYRLAERLPLEQVSIIGQNLMTLSEVEYAEPDAIMQPSLTPNDPQYSNQWHYFAPSAGNYGINAPAAWDITTGSASIVVADIDTGITNHADLSGRTVPGYDFINDPLVANDGGGRDSDPSDPGDWITQAEHDSGYFAGCTVTNSSWHGTHTAGTIGAASNNSLGVAGVNWNSKILPVRVLGKCGGYISDIADGMRWSAGLTVTGVPANPNPAKVENLSLRGIGACSTTYQDAINAITAASTTVVVSAGNDNADASGFQPGNCNGVITVAATNLNGSRAYYSNYGSTVEISAPGGEQSFANDPNGILSTLNTGTQGPVADTYIYYQGTSMAAPHVTGVVSLLYSVNPLLTPTQVLQLLQHTATNFPGGSTCNTGICGSGIVNAGAAITYDSAGTLPICGSITDTYWTNGFVYYITCDSTVLQGKTLTIEPGAIVKVRPNYRLIVAGKLIVQGTTGQPVYFTSYKDDSIGGDTDGTPGSTGAPNDWAWIEFTSTSDPTSSIDHAIIRYGGYIYYGNTKGNILLTDASPTIQNSTISDSSGDGIYVNSTLAHPISHPTITACTFNNNLSAAISIDANSLLTLTGNQVSNNATNGVEVRGGTLNSSATWDQNNLVYRLAGDMTVANAQALTIGPNMIFKFNNNIRLIIAGKLTVQGTTGQPVYFTSYKDDSIGGDTDGTPGSTGAPNDWAWIEFTSTSDPTSSIDHAIIRYGGYIYYGNTKGNILLTDASPTIQNSTISDSSGDGIYVNSTLAHPISHPTITACTFNNNLSAAISIDANSLLTLTGNQVSNNATNGVEVRGGTLNSSATWDQNNLVYRLAGDMTVANAQALTIGPNMIFKFNNNIRLIIAGKLTVQGTTGQPVYFTSYKDDSIGGDTDGTPGSTGAPNDWAWIEFTSTSDPTSSIDHAIIRYGGYIYYGNTKGNILLTDASPTIQNSTISDSSGDGIYVNSTLAHPISHPTITACTFNNNLSAAISIDANSLLTLTGNQVSNNATNGVEVRGGTLNSSATWDQNNLVYRLAGDMTVANAQALTIGPNMIFKFNNNIRLIIAGKLTVQGTTGQPVYFTSYKDDSIGGDTDGTPGSTGAPNDWAWIEFTSTSDPTSSIDHAIIRYGGYIYYGNTKGNILLTDASPTIQNSTISDSSGDGIYVNSTLAHPISHPTITACTFNNNLSAAISIDANSLLTLTGNQVSNNATNGVEVRGGTLNSSATWDQNNLVYRLAGDMTVANAQALTIGPNMIFKFNNNIRLIIAGKLTVQGTTGQPVYFTSYKDDSIGGDTDGTPGSTGAPNDWAWIEFTSTSDPTSSIDHAIIRYGGYIYYGNTKGNILLTDASPTIQNSTISDSSGDGIYVNSTLAHPISHPTITACTFNNNLSAAISIDANSLLTLTGNQVSSNATNGVEVRGGTLNSSATWDQNNLVYRLAGDMTVANAQALTIGPNMIFKFNNNIRLIIAGKLTVQGTTGQPVYFTSYKDDSIGGDTDGTPGSTGAPNDWAWIEFTSTSDPTSSIDHAIIRYGGYIYYNNYRGNVFLTDASPIIQNSILSNGSIGIYASNSTPNLICNDIYSNQNYGLYNATVSTIVNAINQWWGSPSGPYHSSNPAGEGNQVSDGVDFDPWAPHSCVNNLAPNMPSNPSPADDAENQPINVILSWTGGDPDGDDVTYDVYFGIDEDPPLVSSRQSETSYDPGILNYETTYYWRIVAWDQLDAIASGPTWNFTTNIAPPLVFNKLSPPDGATDIVINPILSWEISGGASSYEYCIDTIINNSCDSEWIDVGGSTTVDLSGLSYLTLYEWQVRAVNIGGTTYANDRIWWNFKTIMALPQAFNKISPLNGATNIVTNPTLSWEISGGATSYEYCYDTTDDNTCDGEWINSGTNTSVNLTGLINNTTYYWQVRAVNIVGATEANSGTWWSFSTINNYRVFLPVALK